MFKNNAAVLIMLGALTVGSILACGSPTGGTPCTTDADCQDNFICDGELNECVETCTNDDECDPNDECVVPPGSSGSQKICYTRSEKNNKNNENKECANNEDCGDVEQFLCNAQNKCEAIAAPSTQYYVIKVEDTSTGDDACKASDPGSDILFARLLDSSGDVLGYGSQIALEFGEAKNAKGNIYQDYAHLSGGRPSGLEAGAEQCPDGPFKEASLVALGCSGKVIFEFLDGTDKPIVLKADMKVEVGEFGPNCGGSDADTYEVALCTDTKSAKNGSFSSCTNVLGSSFNSGFVSVGVDLPQ